MFNFGNFERPFYSDVVFTTCQNTVEKRTNIKGLNTSIILSNFFAKFSCNSSCSAVSSSFLWNNFFELLSSTLWFSNSVYFFISSIGKYSARARMMKLMHAVIHMTMAVASPSALGELLATELNVLIWQRKVVRSKPIRPGIASDGTAKLIWKAKALEFFRRNLYNEMF